jgi:putative exporter of polyketide antibiotics
MDSTMIIRVIIAVAIGIVLVMQAQRMQNQPNRKRAFQLGAAALGCFTIFNAGIGMGMEFGAFQQLIAIVGVLLFVASAISLVLALRAGETNADRQRMQDEMRAFAKDREGASEKKPE